VSTVERERSVDAQATHAGAERTPERLGAASVGEPLRGLAAAVSLLTIVPLPRSWVGDGELGRATVWFPVVGALTGGLAGGVLVLARTALGPLPAAALALTALVVTTGALHQDGLADTADGLGARGGRERRLAAMRDPAVGVFGIVALQCWGILMVATLASLTAAQGARALVLAGAVSRWSALAHATLAPPARGDGLGAAFAVRPTALTIAGVAALGAAVALGGLAGAGAAALGSVVVALGTAALARRTLGGRTGDTLGAAVALSEAAACLALLGVWGGA
jgi:adenosylcobinamide-GDP ribazoletransferase